MFGFYETMVQYYLPGVDTSQLSDKALAMKIAHLAEIRKQEAELKLNFL